MTQGINWNKENEPKHIRPGSKARETRPAQLRTLLRRRSGASITELQDTFGWQPHTARAAISGLRKAGETIERRSSAKDTVYRIAKQAPGK